MEKVGPILENLEVDKVAVIRPHRFLPKVSTEQWVDDWRYHPDFYMKMFYFDTESAAMAWLYHDVIRE